MKKLPLKLYLVFIGAVFCSLFSYFLSNQNNYTTEELAASSEIILQNKETVVFEKLSQIAEQVKQNYPKKPLFKTRSFLNDLQIIEGVSFFIYKNDSLCFWTDNQPAIELHGYTNENDIQLIKIRNGWFEHIKLKVNEDYTATALISIKSEYDFENKYLNNNFSNWLQLPENSKLIYPASYLRHSVKSKTGALLFQISRTEGLFHNRLINFYASILYCFAFVLFAIALFLLNRIFLKTYSVLITIILLITVRCIMIYFKLPQVFYNTHLYDVKIFADANSFLYSYLGDILFNSLIIFTISILYFKNQNVFSVKNNLANTGITLMIILSTIYLSVTIQNLIYSLIYNSTISFNINDLFNFSFYSVVGLFSIGILVFSFYLITEKTSIYISSQKMLLFSILGTILILFLLVSLSACCRSIIDYLWSLPLIFISLVLRKYKASYNFINIGVVILVSTVIISALFYKHEKLNKQQNLEAISLNLADRQDVIAENEFIKISASIKCDVQLKNLLSLLPLSNEQIDQRLRQINFSGYFERYEIVMSLFKNDCTPVFLNVNPIYLNEDYFKNQIENGGSQTVSDDLFFIDQEKKSVRYIAKIDIDDVSKSKDKSFRLYIQLEPKLAANTGIFPDLLLDKSLENKLESKQLSYAIYDSQKLRNSFGDYQYPLYMNSLMFKDGHNDSYRHFVFNSKNNTIIVISDKEYGLWGRFTSNSYLFIFFSLIVLSGILFNYLILKRSQRFSTLNNRIQFILVSIVVLSLTIVVIGTIWVVTTQFELKNQKDLIQKSQSVLQELQQTIGQQENLDLNYKDFTNYRLKRFSQLFGSDISLFDKNGILFASSQPAIYEQGLISKFMSPTAYVSFLNSAAPNYTEKESIGSLKFLSAYQPFYSKRDKLLGYINLPYFSRQKDLEKELTAYLTTLINIYTILFVITTLLALLVSNLLTKPLRIIKTQISNIQFGKINNALKWNSHDEIGDLVSEYNKMLLKLEKSSVLLAQSERESAWREMAKQVAHEIKNPLTPMKLNIQHLQRVIETNPDDINERVNKVSKMLIEQIDSLTHIANEFSNFAKLPKANLEIVNLQGILENVSHLFQQNTKCNIILDAPNNLSIFADKDQCLRIFTNILKNAEQAIPLNREGIIEIKTQLTDSEVIVTIKDNGIGISDEAKLKIFEPNFTTKTTGTGLGLAMTKNLVASFNGTISFSTELNVGTIFTVSFPIAVA
jgi:two-component system, NtrC family, nitrogen regulation sensor histidine kinase NtrY